VLLSLVGNASTDARCSAPKVIVWWQHISVRRELAIDETNEDGYYRMRYPVPEQFRASCSSS
jgi:hypothetical protein